MTLSFLIRDWSYYVRNLEIVIECKDMIVKNQWINKKKNLYIMLCYFCGYSMLKLNFVCFDCWYIQGVY